MPLRSFKERARLFSAQRGTLTACAVLVLTPGLTRNHGVAQGAPEKKANEEKTLTVATYRSFVGSYGPGDQIKELFTADCKCQLKWVTSTDAGSLLTDLKLGRYEGVDVILGFDQFQIEAMKATGKLLAVGLPSGVNKNALHPAVQGYTGVFQPVDFGFFAFMYDAEKVKAPPTDLAGWLASPEMARSIALQDPRTSSPGYGLLAWIHQSSGDQKSFEANLGRLKKQALSFSKGWSESYGLLTKGEAKAAFSYVTSEVYHRVEEKSSRYKAALLSGGHPLQIEFAARTVRKASDETAKIADDFMKFLVTDRAQRVIAQKNWMLPVSRSAAKDLPPAFLEALEKPTALSLNATYGTTSIRKLIIDAWKASY